jgi:uncharacterized membrane protein YcaP (DUF421 family)
VAPFAATIMGAMWTDLTHLDISVLDKIIRTVVVYLALIALLRVAGKRDLAQLNSFDLIVVLLLSNVVQNAVIGPDNSLVGGLLGATVLIAANAVLVRWVRPHRRIAGLMEGTTTVLARGGRWIPEALRHEGVRQTDMEAALRRQNAYKVSDVDEVKLEPGGTIVVDLRPELESATKADIERLEAKLDRLLAG